MRYLHDSFSLFLGNIGYIGNYISDFNDKVLNRLAETDASFADEIFSRVKICTGCNKDNKGCINNNVIEYKGKKKTNCTLIVQFKMIPSDFDDVKKVIQAITDIYAITKHEVLTDKDMNEPNIIKGRHFNVVGGDFELKGKEYHWRVPKALRNANIQKGDLVSVKSDGKKYKKVIVTNVSYEDTGNEYKAVLCKLDKSAFLNRHKQSEQKRQDETTGNNDMEKDTDVQTYFNQHNDSESNISNRAINALTKGGITTMDELCAADMKDIKDIRNLGNKSLEYVIAMREKYMADK